MNKGTEINDHYHSEKPEAYGGKNRLYIIYKIMLCSWKKSY